MYAEDRIARPQGAAHVVGRRIRSQIGARLARKVDQSPARQPRAICSPESLARGILLERRREESTRSLAISDTWPSFCRGQIAGQTVQVDAQPGGVERRRGPGRPAR